MVTLGRHLPDGRTVDIYGLVTQVRARHEGARCDSDVFLIEDGILPAEVSQAAQVLATRFEPEVFVPPLPGQLVYKAEGADRDMALYFDGMAKRLPAGLTRDSVQCRRCRCYSLSRSLLKSPISTARIRRG